MTEERSNNIQIAKDYEARPLDLNSGGDSHRCPRRSLKSERSKSEELRLLLDVVQHCRVSTQQ